MLLFNVFSLWLRTVRVVGVVVLFTFVLLVGCLLGLVWLCLVVSSVAVYFDCLLAGFLWWLG